MTRYELQFEIQIGDTINDLHEITKLGMSIVHTNTGVKFWLVTNKDGCEKIDKVSRDGKVYFKVAQRGGNRYKKVA